MGAEFNEYSKAMQYAAMRGWMVFVEDAERGTIVAIPQVGAPFLLEIHESDFEDLYRWVRLERVQ